MERTLVIEVGQGRVLPAEPVEWKSVKEVRVFGDIYHDADRAFLGRAKQNGVNMAGMDEAGIAYIHNDSTVDTTRG